MMKRTCRSPNKQPQIYARFLIVQKGQFIRSERLLIIGSIGFELVQVMSYNSHKYIPWEDINTVELVGKSTEFTIEFLHKKKNIMQNRHFFSEKRDLIYTAIYHKFYRKFLKTYLEFPVTKCTKSGQKKDIFLRITHTSIHRLPGEHSADFDTSYHLMNLKKIQTFTEQPNSVVLMFENLRKLFLEMQDIRPFINEIQNRLKAFNKDVPEDKKTTAAGQILQDEFPELAVDSLNVLYSFRLQRIKPEKSQAFERDLLITSDRIYEVDPPLIMDDGSVLPTRIVRNRHMLKNIHSLVRLEKSIAISFKEESKSFEYYLESSKDALLCALLEMTERNFNSISIDQRIVDKFESGFLIGNKQKPDLGVSEMMMRKLFSLPQNFTFFINNTIPMTTQQTQTQEKHQRLVSFVFRELLDNFFMWNVAEHQNLKIREKKILQLIFFILRSWIDTRMSQNKENNDISEEEATVLIMTLRVLERMLSLSFLHEVIPSYVQDMNLLFRFLELNNPLLGFYAARCLRWACEALFQKGAKSERSNKQALFPINVSGSNDANLEILWTVLQKRSKDAETQEQYLITIHAILSLLENMIHSSVHTTEKPLHLKLLSLGEKNFELLFALGRGPGNEALNCYLSAIIAVILHFGSEASKKKLSSGSAQSVSSDSSDMVTNYQILQNIGLQKAFILSEIARAVSAKDEKQLFLSSAVIGYLVKDFKNAMGLLKRIIPAPFFEEDKQQKITKISLARKVFEQKKDSSKQKKASVLLESSVAQKFSSIFSCLSQTVKTSTLIWNEECRKELLSSVLEELERFEKQITLFKSIKEIEILWNSHEFDVPYLCLTRNIKVGDYYLEPLYIEVTSANGDATLGKINEPKVFFEQLHHKVLFHPNPLVKAMCLNVETNLYRLKKSEIGGFNYTADILLLLRKFSATCAIVPEHRALVIPILGLLHMLVSSGDRRITFELLEQDGIQIIFSLLLPFLKHTRISEEFSSNLSEDEIERLKSDERICSICLNMLTYFVKYQNSNDSNGKLFLPIPKTRKLLMEPAHLQLLVLLLATTLNSTSIAFSILQELCGPLFSLKKQPEDIKKFISKFYATGAFYFVFLHSTIEIDTINLVKMMQAVQEISNSAEGIPEESETDNNNRKFIKSALTGLLPQEMIHQMLKLPSEKFVEIYNSSNFLSPFTVWNDEMRSEMRQTLLNFLADFLLSMREGQTNYTFKKLPKSIEYSSLKNLLIVNHIYINHLVNTSCWAEDIIIENPVSLTNALFEKIAFFNAEKKKMNDSGDNESEGYDSTIENCSLCIRSLLLLNRHKFVTTKNLSENDCKTLVDVFQFPKHKVLSNVEIQLIFQVLELIIYYLDSQQSNNTGSGPLPLYFSSLLDTLLTLLATIIVQFDIKNCQRTITELEDAKSAYYSTNSQQTPTTKSSNSQQVTEKDMGTSFSVRTEKPKSKQFVFAGDDYGLPYCNREEKIFYIVIRSLSMVLQLLKWIPTNSLDPILLAPLRNGQPEQNSIIEIESGIATLIQYLHLPLTIAFGEIEKILDIFATICVNHDFQEIFFKNGLIIYCLHFILATFNDRNATNQDQAPLQLNEKQQSEKTSLAMKSIILLRRLAGWNENFQQSVFSNIENQKIISVYKRLFPPHLFKDLEKKQDKKFFENFFIDNPAPNSYWNKEFFAELHSFVQKSLVKCMRKDFDIESLINFNYSILENQLVVDGIFVGVFIEPSIKPPVRQATFSEISEEIWVSDLFLVLEKQINEQNKKNVSLILEAISQCANNTKKVSIEAQKFSKEKLASLVSLFELLNNWKMYKELYFLFSIVLSFLTQLLPQENGGKNNCAPIFVELGIFEEMRNLLFKQDYHLISITESPSEYPQLQERIIMHDAIRENVIVLLYLLISHNPKDFAPICVDNGLFFAVLEIILSTLVEPTARNSFNFDHDALKVKAFFVYSQLIENCTRCEETILPMYFPREWLEIWRLPNVPILLKEPNNANAANPSSMSLASKISSSTMNASTFNPKKSTLPVPGVPSAGNAAAKQANISSEKKPLFLFEREFSFPEFYWTESMFILLKKTVLAHLKILINSIIQVQESEGTTTLVAVPEISKTFNHFDFLNTNPQICRINYEFPQDIRGIFIDTVHQNMGFPFSDRQDFAIGLFEEIQKKYLVSPPQDRLIEEWETINTIWICLSACFGSGEQVLDEEAKPFAAKFVKNIMQCFDDIISSYVYLCENAEAQNDTRKKDAVLKIMEKILKMIEMFSFNAACLSSFEVEDLQPLLRAFDCVDFKKIGTVSKETKLIPISYTLESMAKIMLRILFVDNSPILKLASDPTSLLFSYLVNKSVTLSQTKKNQMNFGYDDSGDFDSVGSKSGLSHEELQFMIILRSILEKNGLEEELKTFKPQPTAETAPSSENPEQQAQSAETVSTTNNLLSVLQEKQILMRVAQATVPVIDKNQLFKLPTGSANIKLHKLDCMRMAKPKGVDLSELKSDLAKETFNTQSNISKAALPLLEVARVLSVDVQFQVSTFKLNVPMPTEDQQNTDIGLVFGPSEETKRKQQEEFERFQKRQQEHEQAKELEKQQIEKAREQERIKIMAREKEQSQQQQLQTPMKPQSYGLVSEFGTSPVPSPFMMPQTPQANEEMNDDDEKLFGLTSPGSDFMSMNMNSQNIPSFDQLLAQNNPGMKLSSGFSPMNSQTSVFQPANSTFSLMPPPPPPMPPMGMPIPPPPMGMPIPPPPMGGLKPKAMSSQPKQSPVQVEAPKPDFLSSIKSGNFNLKKVGSQGSAKPKNADNVFDMKAILNKKIRKFIESDSEDDNGKDDDEKDEDDDEFDD